VVVDAPTRRIPPALGPACLVIALTAMLLAGHSAATTATALRCPPLEEAAELWAKIVDEVGETVPPRLLLGGKGDCAPLDRVLTARGLSRAEFQQNAALVITLTGAAADGAARTALATGFANFPLPPDVEIPDIPAPEDVPRPPALESARTLVLNLIARLEAS
jgi:hypothetical protein